jgi:ankyrin repeat protein
MLHLATFFNRIEIIKLLLKNNSKIIKDNKDISPYDIAKILKYNDELLNLLK